jgi:hypothetical protein
MGAFQFGHLNTYARKPKPGQSDSARSVREILGEAARMAENCPHVTNPKPPVHIAGMTPDMLAERLDMLLAERAIEGKRKPRGDVHVLAAGVYSWPEHVDYYDQSRLDGWIADQLAWHRQHIGPVDCAVLHLDEAFPHVHVYTADPDARRLVPGWQAKRQALAAGAPAKEANKAYREAMIGWQDVLYEGVGQYHGLDRLGPKRQRLRRPEFRAAKQARFDAGDRLRRIRHRAASAEKLLGGEFKPAEPLEAGGLPRSLLDEALEAAGEPHKPMFGKEPTLTVSQAKKAIEEAGRRIARAARADEQRRYQPVLDQLEEAAGMPAALERIAEAAREAEAKRQQAQQEAAKARQMLQEVEVKAEHQKTLETRLRAFAGRESQYQQALDAAIEREAQLEREKEALAERLAEYEPPTPRPGYGSSSFEP